MKFVKGDVTQPGSRNVDLVVHCVNGAYKMGSGVALALMERWPVVRKIYMAQDSLELGSVHFVNVQKETWVANLVGQPDVRSTALPVPLDYSALRAGMDEVARWSTKVEDLGWTVSLHLPRIGCGLAGGDWNTVALILNDKLKNFPVTIYDFD